MMLKIKCYLSTYNEYYEVSVEGAFINKKLIIGNLDISRLLIGNRVSGTWN